MKKFSPEWYEAKKQARKDLDYKLSLGVRHGDTSIVAPVEGSTPDAPKKPRASRKSAAAPKKPEAK